MRRIMNPVEEQRFNETCDRAFGLAKKGVIGFVILWIVGAILGLGLTGLVIVLLVKLIQHL